MTYIDLVNNFWLLDVEYHFSDKEISLYFYLLKTCNYARWKNPFGLSNAITIAKFGWGKTSFDTAKNNLKKAGLIDFEPGDGRGKVYQYWICNVKVTGKDKKVTKKGAQKNTLSDHLSTTLSDHLSKSRPATSLDNKDLEEEKDNSETNVSATASASSSKNRKKNKEEETTDFWQPMVDVWFAFNQEHLQITPSFKGSDPRDLKGIVEILKKRAVAGGFEWTEKQATDTLTAFLVHSFKDTWLKQHFLLSNLLKQFDKIVAPRNGQTNNNNRQQDLTGIKSELAAELGLNIGKS